MMQKNFSTDVTFDADPVPSPFGNDENAPPGVGAASSQAASGSEGGILSIAVLPYADPKSHRFTDPTAVTSNNSNSELAKEKLAAYKAQATNVLARFAPQVAQAMAAAEIHYVITSRIAAEFAYANSPRGGAASGGGRPRIYRVRRNLEHLLWFRTLMSEKVPYGVVNPLPVTKEDAHSRDGVDQVVAFLSIFSSCADLKGDPLFWSLLTKPDDEFQELFLTLKPTTSTSSSGSSSSQHNNIGSTNDHNEQASTTPPSSTPFSARNFMGAIQKKLMSNAKKLVAPKYPSKALKPDKISDMLMETGVIDRALMSLDKVNSCVKTSYYFEDEKLKNASREKAWEDAAQKAFLLRDALEAERDDLLETANALRDLAFPSYWPWTRDSVMEELRPAAAPTASALDTKTPAKQQSSSAASQDALGDSTQAEAPSSPQPTGTPATPPSATTPWPPQISRPPPSQRLTHYLHLFFFPVVLAVDARQCDGGIAASSSPYSIDARYKNASETAIIICSIPRWTGDSTQAEAHSSPQPTGTPATPPSATTAWPPQISRPPPSQRLTHYLHRVANAAQEMGRLSLLIFGEEFAISINLVRMTINARTLSASAAHERIFSSEHQPRPKGRGLCDIQALLNKLVAEGTGHEELDAFDAMDDEVTAIHEETDEAVNSFERHHGDALRIMHQRLGRELKEMTVGQVVNWKGALLLLADLKTTLELDQFMDGEELPFTNAPVVHNPSPLQKRRFEAQQQVWGQQVTAFNQAQQDDETTNSCTATKSTNKSGFGTLLESRGQPKRRQALQYDDEGTNTGSASGGNPFDTEMEMTATTTTAESTGGSPKLGGSGVDATPKRENSLHGVLPDELLEVVNSQSKFLLERPSNRKAASMERPTEEAAFDDDDAKSAAKRGSWKKTKAKKSGWGGVAQEDEEDPFRF
ncbi:Hypothetical protein, putative [Bodo saltans]|uniref:PX domain-containing protein n=1 Tax=Bodo saltans TaxID=75058 RepID=A0A0S4JR30_BODSA|nr:Hypothetical protein, putative [Bodo saltans]|eukprot:CUG91773.1 Hypothetical protein, putative [Bodo saltans]